MKKKKVIVVMPAYNAARTLLQSYRKLPKEYVDEIILVDDASTDTTYDIAKKIGLRAYRNNINLGYGGNLKVCLTKALEHKADIIIEYHPDNQYDPANLPIFLEKAKGGCDFALGSRFIHPKEALERRMPLIKWIANRGLTFIDQFVLGIELSEFHSGFRLYTRKLLTSVPYLQNSDDYLFSFEIIVQAVYFNFKVTEVQISCDYHPDMHTANLYKSTTYALGTFKTLLQYVQAKFLNRPSGPFCIKKSALCPVCRATITYLKHQVIDAVSNKHFSIIFCTQCQIGFTHPSPKNISQYYPHMYYSKLKTIIYDLLQHRRLSIISHKKKTGNVLDIGCGDSTIAQKLMNHGYMYTGIETPFSNSRAPYIKCVGIENMHERVNSYDFVTFWESFEHLPRPDIALQKTHAVLKKSGYIIIECPNFGSWERLLFGNRWFHLDPPRHLFHYTQKGLKNLLKNYGFSVVEERCIYAPDYIPIGLAQSLLYRLSPRYNIFAQKDLFSKMTLGFFLIATATLMIPVSYLLYLLKRSSIQLIIAKKTTK